MLLRTHLRSVGNGSTSRAERVPKEETHGKQQQESQGTDEEEQQDCDYEDQQGTTEGYCMYCHDGKKVGGNDKRALKLN